MKLLLRFLFKLPPFSLIPFAFHHKRKLPGLIWVGGLGFLAWKKFGPQITERLQAATADYPPPASGPWSGPTGDQPAEATPATPTMSVAEDLAPANAAPEIPHQAPEIAEPASEPDPAPVTTTG